MTQHFVAPQCELICFTPLNRKIDMAVMIFTAFLVVLLEVVMKYATTASASPASVNIYNVIDGAEPVHMTCGAFGDKAVAYGEHFGWGFSYSVTGKTRWSCGFRWGSKVQFALVWYDDRSETRAPFRMCVHCAWVVKPEGFYLKNDYGYEPPVLVYSWFSP